MDTARALVVLGSVNLDVVTEVAALPRPGETVTALRLRRNVGGKGANQAVAAHLLGADVTLVARVGDDPDSERLCAGLAETGLDTAAVRPVPGQPAGTAHIAVAGGENTIVVVPGANHAWREGLGPDAGAVASAGVLVLQQEVPCEVNELAADVASGRVILNAAPSRRLSAALLSRCDPVVLNALELADQLGSGRASADVPAAMAALLGRGARSVVTTLGSAGAVWTTGAGSGQVPAPAVPAVDTTGAGDAFVGALAAELAAGARLPDAVGWAVAAASASVRSAGTHASYPNRAAVRELLRSR